MTGSVIVFGGSRGIGRLLTTHFLSNGWAVTAAARTATTLETLKEETGARAALETVLTDIGDEPRVRAVFEAHEAAFHDAPSVVVNAAAVQGPIGPSWTASAAEWQRALRTNLVGAFLVTKCAIASMIPAGAGSIIHFSGGGAAYGRPNFSAYAASKAGLLRLIETVATELRQGGYPGITINAIAPGGVKTEMTDEILRQAETAGAAEAAAAEQVRRSGGTPPRLISALVDFLCDPSANRGVSGRLFHVKDDYVGFAAADEVSNTAGKLRRVPLQTKARRAEQGAPPIK